MKAKPLKNKIYFHNVKNATGKTNQKYPYHYDNDIKSAVEWLKRKIRARANKLDCGCKGCLEINDIIDEDVSKAFEDVTK